MSKNESNKFTSTVEHAITVKLGGQDCPVLAPGYVNGWARIAHRRQLKLWDHLLDAMEENYSLPRGTEEYEEAGGLEEELFRNVRVSALEQALAILEYGDASEHAVGLVQAQAKIRYEQEAE